MIVNVYQILQSDTDVISYVGERIYMSLAPQGAEPPHCVYTPVSNVAYNSLSLAPDADQQRHQIDAYAKNPATARELTKAIRDCIQQYGNIVAGPIALSFEPDSDLHRWSLDVSLFHAREVI